VISATPMNCLAHFPELTFKLQPDRTYTMVSTHDSKAESLLNFKLFFIGYPYTDVVSGNPGLKLRMEKHQLIRLRKIANAFRSLDKSFNKCSWGKLYSEFCRQSDIQQKKLSVLLNEIFIQNHFNV